MRTQTLVFGLVLLSPGCFNGAVRADSLKEADDIVNVCEQYTPAAKEIRVDFPAQTEACPWGQGDNLDAGSGGVITARAEQTARLDLPEHAIICDLAFDFGGLTPEDVQLMTYDDHFFFNFNDIVMAASLGPAVDRFEAEGELHTYDWHNLVGFPYHIDTESETYCLGQGSGEAADCVIPGTEVEGEIELHYGDSVVSALSLSAIQNDRYEFSFVTTGDDNPESDCRHEAFGFTVQVPYLAGY